MNHFAFFCILLAEVIALIDTCTSFSDFKRKEVINVCDGARLGTPCDIEFNQGTGIISSIIVPGHAKLLGILKSSEEIVIPYSKIIKIGEDVILVEITF